MALQSLIAPEALELDEILPSEMCFQDDFRTEKNRKARELRAEKRLRKIKAAEFVSINKFNVGATNYPATRKGFKAKALPKHFIFIINNIRTLVYSGFFNKKSNGLTRDMPKKCKRKLFEVLVTIITNTDLLSGSIGIPKSNGLHALKHDDLMYAHALRFGYSMPSSTWYRYIDILKSHDVFNVIEAKSHVSRGKVKSYAAYKWFSQSFLKKIGLSIDTVKSSVEKAYQKALSKGLSFNWVMVITDTIRKHHDPVCYEFDFDAPPPAGAFIQ